ncbi:hypothetical protein SAMN05421770_106187 [Granulicella rosea]|uniref:Uncharacterized protein n=1 Tax=Granulicella rosea TaxID=474952 RepID=A0A239LA74_9BACT|nr:hypothetical protein SAMN05421770_106187 [Granulicella rosea]
MAVWNRVRTDNSESEKQIRFGMTNKRGNGDGKGKGQCGVSPLRFAPVEMTGFVGEARGPDRAYTKFVPFDWRLGCGLYWLCWR